METFRRFTTAEDQILITEPRSKETKKDQRTRTPKLQNSKMDTFSMVRGIQARRIAAQAEAERDCAATSPPVLPLVDARPVRGVVTLQARPLLRSTDRPMSVLLVVNRSTLVVQTLQKPYRDLLELQLQSSKTSRHMWSQITTTCF